MFFDSKKLINSIIFFFHNLRIFTRESCGMHSKIFILTEKSVLNLSSILMLIVIFWLGRESFLQEIKDILQNFGEIKRLWIINLINGIGLEDSDILVYNKISVSKVISSSLHIIIKSLNKMPNNIFGLEICLLIFSKDELI